MTPERAKRLHPKPTSTLISICEVSDEDIAETTPVLDIPRMTAMDFFTNDSTEIPVPVLTLPHFQPVPPTSNNPRGGALVSPQKRKAAVLSTGNWASIYLLHPYEP